MATYRGSTLVEAPQVSTWKNGVGGQTKRTFHGTEAEITAKAIELQAAGYETEITTGAAWTLVATYNVDLITGGGSTTEPDPVPQWELIPHSIEQNIFECGRPFIKDLPSTVKAAIDAKLKNPKDSNLFVVPPAYINNNAMIEKAMRIYTYKNGGVDSRRVNVVSLKRTITVSAAYTATWSLTNNLKVLTTTKVVNLYGVPAIISGLMPASGDDSETVPFDDVAVQNIVVPWYNGWLEQRPSYQTVGVNRISISQEWLYNRWLVGTNGLYDLVT